MELQTSKVIIIHGFTLALLLLRYLNITGNLNSSDVVFDIVSFINFCYSAILYLMWRIASSNGAPSKLFVLSVAYKAIEKEKNSRILNAWLVFTQLFFIVFFLDGLGVYLISLFVVEIAGLYELFVAKKILRLEID